jgi:hypothetical protein
VRIVGLFASVPAALVRRTRGEKEEGWEGRGGEGRELAQSNGKAQMERERDVRDRPPMDAKKAEDGKMKRRRRFPSSVPTYKLGGLDHIFHDFVSWSQKKRLKYA